MSANDGSSMAEEFQALEQKVLRAVGVLRQEREARASAEAETARLGRELDELRREHQAAQETMGGELESLRRERDDVRQRVETMLHQMDELL